MGIRSSIAVLFLISVCTFTQAQTLQQQQQRKAALEKDIAILQSQLSSTSSKSEQALSSLHLIQAQKSSLQKMVKESENTIAIYNRNIKGIQSEIRLQQEALDTLSAHYSRLVLGAYKNRDVRIWYMYILASDNVSQAFRRFSYFKNLSAQLNSQALKIEQFKAELTVKKDTLLSVKRKAQAVLKDREKELSRIKSNEAQQDKIVKSLKKDKSAFQKSLKAKQNEMKALDQQINRMIKEASSKTKPKASAEELALALSFEKNKGKLPWPVDGPVTEHYGPYKNKELKLNLFNNGINIACRPSTEVKAVFDGVVSNIMIAPGYGQCILIQHGGYYTSYCKVKNAKVRQGDKVHTGQTLGEVATIMGKTQLYFLVFKKKYVDPEAWLRPR